MKKILFLSVLFMIILTGCFEKKTRADTGSNAEYLEITNFTVDESSGETVTLVGDANTPGSSIIIESSTLIPIDKIVTISFSESIDARTVNASTAYINDPNGNPIPAQITVVDNQINIIPNAFFLPDERYTIVITEGVKDIRGRSLERIFNYIFPTESDVTVGPTLLSVSPANGTVTLTTTAVVMTFSEDIMGNGIIILRDSATNAVVEGTTSTVGSTLRFVPQNELINGANYIVSLQGTVEDFEGDVYEGITTWSFSIVPLVPELPPLLPPVGDITPPTLTLLTPFDTETDVNKTTDVSMTFDENILDNGVSLEVKDSLNVVILGIDTVSANTLTFTPSNDLNDSETYTVTLLNTVKDLAGNDYTGTSTWSFTVALAPDTTAPVITLTGANPQTLEMGSVYVELNASTDDGSPITIDSSTVDMNSVGEYNVTYNAIDASNNQAAEVIRTVIVEDTTDPTLTSLTPSDSATNVDKAINMTMVFDENIADNNAYLEVKDSLNNIVVGTNSISANTLNFNPTNDLNDSETYTVTLQNNVEDLAGNIYTGTSTWSFTTTVVIPPPTDTTPPTLTSLTPTEDETDVDKAINMTMVFDENIADNNASLEVRDSLNTIIVGTNSISANTLNFNPTNDLNDSETYTVTLQNNVEDLAGNIYTGTSSWSFTVATLLDTTPPTLISLTPLDGAVNVDSGTDINMTFNEEVINAGAILKLTDNTLGTLAGGTSGFIGNTLWFIPDSVLIEDHNYTVDMLGDTTDLEGNVYVGLISWSFTVAPLVDITPPTLTSLTPADSAIDVDRATELSVVFDENVTNASPGFDIIDETDGTPVAGTEGVTGNKVWFIPDNVLIEDHNYTVSINGTTYDLVGNAYPDPITWSFHIKPFEVRDAGYLGKTVRVRFTYELNASTVSAADFEINSGSISFDPATFSYISLLKSVFFEAIEDLDGNETINVSGTIEDLKGNLINDGVPMEYSL